MEKVGRFLHEDCGEVEIEHIYGEKFPKSTTWVTFSSTQSSESWSQPKTAFKHNTKPLTLSR